MQNFDSAVLFILVALVQYLWFAARVGAKRGAHSVKAPAVSGNELWERLNRVHLNTLEQLIIFIPGMLAFAQYASAKWVIIPGAIYLLGRQIYSMTYIKDPATRSAGMAMTFLGNIILLLGALYGVVRAVAGI